MWDPHDCTQNLCKMQKNPLMQHKAWKKKSSKNKRIPFRRFFKLFKGGELRFLEGFQPPDFTKLRKASSFNDIYRAYQCVFDIVISVKWAFTKKVILWISPYVTADMSKITIRSLYWTGIQLRMSFFKRTNIFLTFANVNNINNLQKDWV